MVTCLSSIILLCLFIYILLPLQVYSFADAPIFLFCLTSFAGWTEAVNASRKGILKGEKEAKLILIFFTLSRASVPVFCTWYRLVTDGDKEGQGISVGTLMPVISLYLIIYRALWPGVISLYTLLYIGPYGRAWCSGQSCPCLHPFPLITPKICRASLGKCRLDVFTCGQPLALRCLTFLELGRRFFSL